MPATRKHDPARELEFMGRCAARHCHKKGRPCCDVTHFMTTRKDWEELGCPSHVLVGEVRVPIYPSGRKRNHFSWRFRKRRR